VKVDCFDQILPTADFNHLKKRAENLYLKSGPYLKKQPLIISSTSRFPQDYLGESSEVQSAVKAVFDEMCVSFDLDGNKSYFETWNIFSEINGMHSLSSSHGAHFDDNMWSVLPSDEQKFAAVASGVIYFNTTLTYLRIFPKRYSTIDSLPKPDELLNFQEHQCVENRLVCFEGDLMHTVRGKFKVSDGVFSRMGMVFNVWGKSPARPWWF
jgi:hypothetical protein